MFKVIRSGRFFHTAETNASRANTHLLASSIDQRADPLQIRVPAATPGIIGVADDVSIMRRSAAEFTLE
jgi:hypothetical protein